MIKNIQVVLGVVIAVTAFVAGVLVWKLLSSSVFISINKNQTAVVEEMKQLNRLETASFTIEKVIDAHTNGNAFQELLYGDKILLIAHGQVVAGFDLSKLTQDNIKIKGKSITVQLPAPEVFFTRLDNNLTRVYDRQQGLLSKGQPDLETQARQSAESEIQAAACEEGILDQASESGKKQLTAFLHGLGFTEIQINVPAGHC